VRSDEEVFRCEPVDHGCGYFVRFDCVFKQERSAAEFGPFQHTCLHPQWAHRGDFDALIAIRDVEPFRQSQRGVFGY
jgi:hypothetical protein